MTRSSHSSRVHVRATWPTSRPEPPDPQAHHTPSVCRLGTRAAAAYGTTRICERHRHRYEFNGRYREQLEQAGLVIAGTSPDGGLVEIVELADHPWFVAVQFHPEFKSKPTAAHPLFAGLVAAAVERHAGSAWVAEA